MPSAPNSFETIASRSPRACASRSRWRTSVVLPEPRKPETSSAGMRRSLVGRAAKALGECRMAARPPSRSLAAHGRAVPGGAPRRRERRLVARGRAGAARRGEPAVELARRDRAARARARGPRRAGRAPVPARARLGVRLRRARRPVRARRRRGDRVAARGRVGRRAAERRRDRAASSATGSRASRAGSPWRAMLVRDGARDAARAVARRVRRRARQRPRAARQRRGPRGRAR